MIDTLGYIKSICDGDSKIKAEDQETVIFYTSIGELVDDYDRVILQREQSVVKADDSMVEFKGVTYYAVEGQEELIVERHGKIYVQPRSIPVLKACFSRWDELHEKCPFLFENLNLEETQAL